VDDSKVKGRLVDNGKPLDKPCFHGRWDEALYVDLPDGSERMLWKANPIGSGDNRRVLVFSGMLFRLPEGVLSC
jgi:hypothetical protein